MNPTMTIQNPSPPVVAVFHSQLYLDHTLQTACFSGDAQTALAVLSAGASIDPKNHPLMLAVQGDHPHVIRALCKTFSERMDLNRRDIRDNATVLHKAISSKRTECVKALIEHGAPLDAVDSSGNTGLHLAAETEQADVLTMLIEAGAVTDIRSKSGRTPLHATVLWGSHACVMAWSRLHVPLDDLDNERNTALMVALKMGRGVMALRLIACGANTDGIDVVRYPDYVQLPALHAAARIGWIERVLELLELDVNGAQVALEHRGKTAVDVALDAGKEDVVALFQAVEARRAMDALLPQAMSRKGAPGQPEPRC